MRGKYAKWMPLVFTEADGIKKFYPRDKVRIKAKFIESNRIKVPLYFGSIGHG